MVFTDQGLGQSLPERLHSSGEGNKYRNSQSDNVQRVRHLEILSSKLEVATKSMFSGLRESFIG